MRTVSPGTRYKITAGFGSASKVADQAMGKVPRHNRPDRMNKTEARYGLYLTALMHAGVIDSWAFEDVKLRLADKTFYTPDFMVIQPSSDGNLLLEFHEIKGYERDDAIVKFKCAAERFHRFRFKMIKLVKGEWIVTRDSWA